MDQLPRLRKRELVCLLLFTCNYVVFVWRGFIFLWVLGMGYVILLWQSLSLPYNYFTHNDWTSIMIFIFTQDHMTAWPQKSPFRAKKVMSNIQHTISFFLFTIFLYVPTAKSRENQPSGFSNYRSILWRQPCFVQIAYIVCMLNCTCTFFHSWHEKNLLFQ